MVAKPWTIFPRKLVSLVADLWPLGVTARDPHF